MTPGTRIPVLVGGLPYETVVDRAGRQRFVERHDDPLRRRLIRDLRPAGVGPDPDADVADLNEMAIRYHSGEFGQREYAEFNMSLGYSLDGFCELSSFFDMDVESPIGVPYRVGHALDE